MKRVSMRTGLFFLALAIVAVAVVSEARADVKLPAVISSNMVLQRDCEVPIWGSATHWGKFLHLHAPGL